MTGTLRFTEKKSEKPVSTYAIILKEPLPAVWKKVQEQWPDRHYVLNECAAFVSPSGISTEEQVCAILGINSEAENNGLVIEVTHSYQGYADTGFVQWLRKARDA